MDYEENEAKNDNGKESTSCMIRRKIEDYLESKRLSDEFGFDEFDLDYATE